ncbi:MAG: hypothetical protein H6741_15165 [Alphaproteobacteria bacterium]|nr:hypothetical protein [Alphaproteobacteria bacterium]
MLASLLLAAALTAPTAQADAVVHVSTPTVVVQVGQPAPPPRVVYVAPRPVATQQVCHVIDRGPAGPRGPDTVHCVTQPLPAPARPGPQKKVVVVHR